MASGQSDTAGLNQICNDKIIWLNAKKLLIEKEKSQSEYDCAYKRTI